MEWTSRIRIFGSIGRNVARAQADIGNFNVGHTRELWNHQVRDFASTLYREPSGFGYTFDALAYERERTKLLAELNRLDPELRFALKLAAYLRTLATGQDLEAKARDLLAVETVASHEPGEIVRA